MRCADVPVPRCSPRGFGRSTDYTGQHAGLVRRRRADTGARLFPPHRFPASREAPFATPPFNFSRTPAVLQRSAPAPGEDDRADFSPRGGETEQCRRATAARRHACYRFRRWCRRAGIGVGAGGAGRRGHQDRVASKIWISCGPSRWNRTHPTVLGRSIPKHVAKKKRWPTLRTPRGASWRSTRATAEVVIENNRGGVVRQFGLDYEDVRLGRRHHLHRFTRVRRGGPLGQAPSFGPLNSSFAGSNWL